MTMRLPNFEYVAPATVDEAARLLSDPGRSSLIVGGGTDLFPKIKRRQAAPTTLVSLSGVDEMRGVRFDSVGNCVIGASTLLADLAVSHQVPPVMAIAAASIASPQIRNTATVGGNLCLDTRCNYIDMPETWREASGHCLKDGGEVCWVAPRGNRCWAINSSDLAPVAVALEGSVRLTSVHGERLIPVEDLYHDDGIACHTKSFEEILVELLLPSGGTRATYRKLRRRGSIDFPLLGVAASARFDEAGTCVSARMVIGAAAPAPVRATEAEEFLIGRQFTDEVIGEAAGIASGPVRPQDNTDTGSRYRKWMVPVLVGRALRDLVADDG